MEHPPKKSKKTPGKQRLSLPGKARKQLSLRALGWLFFLGLFLPCALLFSVLWQVLSKQHELERERRQLERTRGTQELGRELERELEWRRRGAAGIGLVLEGLENGVSRAEDGSLKPFEEEVDRVAWEEDSQLLSLPSYLDGLREEQRGDNLSALGRYRLALAETMGVPKRGSQKNGTRLKFAIVRVLLRLGRKEEAERTIGSLPPDQLSPWDAWRTARYRLQIARMKKNKEHLRLVKELRDKLEALRPQLSLLSYLDMRQEISPYKRTPPALRLYRFLAAHRNPWRKDPKTSLIWNRAPGGVLLALLAESARKPQVAVPLRPIRLFRRQKVWEAVWARTVLARTYDWAPLVPGTLGEEDKEKAAPSEGQVLNLGSIGLRIQLKEKTPLAASFWADPRGKFFFLLFLLMQGGLGMGLWTSLRAIGKERRLTKMRSDFVSSVSHELKTPLTGIRLYSDLLLRKEDTEIPFTKRREYVRRLGEEARKLNFLIENVLDRARIESGREYKKERIDLAALMESCVWDFEARFQEKGFRLETSMDRTKDHGILGDPEALGRVLANLLDNALKHGGPKVRLELRTLPAWVELRVQDNGPGIPPSERKRLFLPFERGVTHGPGQAPGSGLGLAIVREIVEGHPRASVQIEDSEDHGLSVLLRFPSAPFLENE
jgi:signal transduction histidine kinase